MNSNIYKKDFIIELSNCHSKLDYRKNVSMPKFVFLCGKSYKKNELTNRHYIEKFLLESNSNSNNNLNIIFAEKVWDIKKNEKIDLLTFEEILAEISDFVILIVESYGTVCELGAFAFDIRFLGDRLNVLIDKKHKNSDSFIMLGPIAKLLSNKAKVIFTNVDNESILESEDLRKLLSYIKSNILNDKKIDINPIKKETSTFLIKPFIFEILQFLEILQPISPDDLIRIYMEIKDVEKIIFSRKNKSQFIPFNQKIEPKLILEILESMDLIKNINNLLWISRKNFVPNDYIFDFSNLKTKKLRSKLLRNRFKVYGDQELWK